MKEILSILLRLLGKENFKINAKISLGLIGQKRWIRLGNTTLKKFKLGSENVSITIMLSSQLEEYSKNKKGYNMYLNQANGSTMECAHDD